MGSCVTGPCVTGPLAGPNRVELRLEFIGAARGLSLRRDEPARAELHVTGLGEPCSNFGFRRFQMWFGEVFIPVPVVSRSVTMGQVLKALRQHKNQGVGSNTPSPDERFTVTIAPVESRRRFALARGRPEADANREACILKDAMMAMDDEDWWAYKFELIGGWLEFLNPYLDEESPEHATVQG